MKLQHLNDLTLHKKTLTLAGTERATTAHLLHHLLENDRRKLYSDYKCSSLFDYCVKILSLSEPSAQRRIVAARLMKEIPDLDRRIEDGVLSLTNLSEANRFFRENDITKPEEKKEILQKIENLSKKDCEKKLFEIFGKEKSVKEEKKRISSNKTQVTYILSDETVAEIERLKSLMGKKLSMDELLKFMAAAGIQKIEKEKFKQVKKPRSLPLARVARTPGAAIKREIYQRDQKCSQCGSSHHLNYDHITPFALGGQTSLENMRLLCSNCNQRARIKVFGTRDSG